MAKVVAGAAVFTLAAGCASGGATLGSPTAEVPSVTARAVLDRATASIELPLDRFGMSELEQARARAARQILFAQCITGSATPSAETLTAARRELAAVTVGSEWLFGFWDAEYIAAQGIAPAASLGLGEGLSVTPQEGARCVESDEMATVPLVSAQTAPDDPSLAVLLALSMEAHDSTLADPRFVALRDRRDECLAGQGYAVNRTNELRGVEIAVGASAEESLKAAVAEATCADRMDYVQQVSDLAATYQQRLVEQHEAELVSVRQRVDAAVAEAGDVLTRAGIS